VAPTAARNGRIVNAVYETLLQAIHMRELSMIGPESTAVVLP